MISNAQLKNARECVQRIKGFQQQISDHVFDGDIKEQLVEQFASLEGLLSSLSGGTAPSVADVTEAVLSGIATQDILWSAVMALDDRVTRIEKSLGMDHGKLLLRESANQLANKLARLCIPSKYSTPYSARHASFTRIKDDKKADVKSMENVTDPFPDLASGVSALNELGIPLAHPTEHMTVDSGATKVTVELLNSLILEVYDGSGDLSAVQQVVACLHAVSQEMGEDLFIDRHKK